MQLNSIGEVFISRTLQLKSKSSKTVMIIIGKPQKYSDGDDFYCPYKITGLGDEKISWGGGIDELQALLLTLENIGNILNNSEEYKQGNLSWIGSANGNLGFPQQDSSEMLKHLFKI